MWGYCSWRTCIALYESPEAFEKVKEKAATLGKEFAVAICEKKEFSEQRKAREEYRIQFATRHAGLKDFWQHDYQYWLDKGWVSKNKYCDYYIHIGITIV